MEKVQQKFKIGRKLITYEGYPSNRARDLMDIMSKLSVADDTVVPTFRENIAESDEYTDEQVLEMYHAAVRARAERKKAKDDGGNANTAGSNTNNNAAAAATSGGGGGASAAPLDTERPRKITLTYRGRQFSYEGLVSGKQRAVVQLLRKQRDVTPEIAIETFRVNLPECTLSDEAIWQLVSDSVQAKKDSNTTTTTGAAAGGGTGEHVERSDSGDGMTAQQQQQQTTTTSSSRSAHQDDDAHASPQQAYYHNQQQQQQQQQSISAAGELANMTTKERDDLNNFIRQVLEQPPMDLATLLREEPRARSEDADESTGLALTARTSGKIVVYCQEEKSSASKIVHATPNMSYSEFANIIEKKYGRPMALSFYEGDDIVELDDDDGLAMFLEMCVQSGSGKKMKLICSDPNTRRRVVEDTLTETRASSNANASGGAVAAGGAGSSSNAAAEAEAAAAARVVAYSNGELQVKEVRTFTGHTLAVYCCAFSPRGDMFVTASRDRSVRLWNTRTGSCTVMKGGHNGFVLSCHFSPRGNRVVSSSDDRSIKVWNTLSSTKVATLKGHEDKVYCVRYNSTGEYIVSGSCDHTVRVWNAESFAKMVTLRGHSLAVFSCDFSNTNAGKYVVSGSDDRMIKIWDWENSRELRTLHGHTGTVWSVCFSHSDAYIVSASMDHELKLWAVATGACVRAMVGHTTPIHHALFSESDRYIFSCARDWSVMVWRTDTGERVETITGHKSTVYHIELQGNKLLTSSLDDTLKLWEINATQGL